MGICFLARHDLESNAGGLYQGLGWRVFSGLLFFRLLLRHLFYRGYLYLDDIGLELALSLGLHCSENVRGWGEQLDGPSHFEGARHLA